MPPLKKIVVEEESTSLSSSSHFQKRDSKMDPSSVGGEEEEGITPDQKDVACGRGKHRWDSPGTTRYKRIISENRQQYIDSTSKAEKSHIVQEIIKVVKSNNSRFIKREPRTNRWKELTQQEVRVKIAHALRDQNRWILSGGSKTRSGGPSSSVGSSSSSSTNNNGGEPLVEATRLMGSNITETIASGMVQHDARQDDLLAQPSFIHGPSFPAAQPFFSTSMAVGFPSSRNISATMSHYSHVPINSPPPWNIPRSRTSIDGIVPPPFFNTDNSTQPFHPMTSFSYPAPYNTIMKRDADAREKGSKTSTKEDATKYTGEGRFGRSVGPGGGSSPTGRKGHFADAAVAGVGGGVGMVDEHDQEHLEGARKQQYPQQHPQQHPNPLYSSSWAHIGSARQGAAQPSSISYENWNHGVAPSSMAPTTTSESNPLLFFTTMTASPPVQAREQFDHCTTFGFEIPTPEGGFSTSPLSSSVIFPSTTTVGDKINDGVGDAVASSAYFEPPSRPARSSSAPKDFENLDAATTIDDQDEERVARLRPSISTPAADATTKADATTPPDAATTTASAPPLSHSLDESDDCSGTGKQAENAFHSWIDRHLSDEEEN